MTEKYPNGMYKNTSKKQDRTSAALFRSVQRTKSDAVMGCEFNQVSGCCEYFFYRPERNGDAVLQALIFAVTVDRDGNILG